MRARFRLNENVLTHRVCYVAWVNEYIVDFKFKLCREGRGRVESNIQFDKRLFSFRLNGSSAHVHIYTKLHTRTRTVIWERQGTSRHVVGNLIFFYILYGLMLCAFRDVRS